MIKLEKLKNSREGASDSTIIACEVLNRKCLYKMDYPVWALDLTKILSQYKSGDFATKAATKKQVLFKK